MSSSSGKGGGRRTGRGGGGRRRPRAGGARKGRARKPSEEAQIMSLIKIHQYLAAEHRLKQLLSSLKKKSSTSLKDLQIRKRQCLTYLGGGVHVNIAGRAREALARNVLQEAFRLDVELATDDQKVLAAGVDADSEPPQIPLRLTETFPNRELLKAIQVSFEKVTSDIHQARQKQKQKPKRPPEEGEEEGEIAPPPPAVSVSVVLELTKSELDFWRVTSRWSLAVADSDLKIAEDLQAQINHAKEQGLRSPPMPRKGWKARCYRRIGACLVDLEDCLSQLRKLCDRDRKKKKDESLDVEYVGVLRRLFSTKLEGSFVAQRARIGEILVALTVIQTETETETEDEDSEDEFVEPTGKDFEDRKRLFFDLVRLFRKYRRETNERMAKSSISIDVDVDVEEPSSVDADTKKKKKKRSKKKSKEEVPVVIADAYAREFDVLSSQMTFLSRYEDWDVLHNDVLPRLGKEIQRKIVDAERRRQQRHSKREKDKLRRSVKKKSASSSLLPEGSVLEDAVADDPTIVESDVISSLEKAKRKKELFKNAKVDLLRKRRSLPWDTAFGDLVEFVADAWSRKEGFFAVPMKLYTLRTQRSIDRREDRGKILAGLQEALTRHPQAVVLARLFLRVWEEDSPVQKMQEFASRVEERLMLLFPYDATAMAIAGARLSEVDADVKEEDDDKRRRLETAAFYTEEGQKGSRNMEFRCITPYVSLCRLYWSRKMPEKVRSVAREGLSCREKRIEALRRVRVKLSGLTMRSQLRRLSLFEGMASFKLKDYPAASKEFQGLQKATPDIVELAEYYQGRLYLRHASPDKARKCFEHIQKLNREGRCHFKALRHLAEICFDVDDLATCEGLLKDARRLAKDDASLDGLMGRLLFQKGEPAEAYPYLVRAVRLNPRKNASSYRLLGQYFDTVSPNPDRCVKCFQRAVRNDPLDSISGFRLVELLQQRKADPDEVVKLLRGVLFRNSRAAWASRCMGFFFLGKNAYNPARKAFQGAIRVKEDALCWEGLGECYFHEGKFLSAVRCYRRVCELARESKDASSLFSSYRIAYVKGLVFCEFDEAGKIFSLLLKKSSGEDSSLSQVILHSYGLMFLRQAQTAFQKGLLSSSEKYLLGGLRALRENESKVASSEGTKFPLQKLKADFLSFHFFLPRTDRSPKFVELALKTYRELLASDPTSFDRTYDTCVSVLQNYFYLKKAPLLAEALRLARRSVEILPKNPVGWNLLGAVYGLSQELQKRRRCHVQAVEMDRRLPDSWTQLGWCYVEEKDLVRAERAFEVSKNLDPRKNFEAYAGLGYVAELSGDLPKALDSYYVSLSVNDTSQFVLNRAARAALILEDEHRLVGLTDAFMKSGSMLGPDGSLLLACLLEKRGAFSEAESVLKKLLISCGGIDGPQAPVVLPALGRLYLRMGSFGKSVAMFEKSLQVGRSPKTPSVPVLLGLAVAKAMLESPAELHSLKVLRHPSLQKNEAAQILTGKILYRKGKADKAVQFITQCLSQYPDSVRLKSVLAALSSSEDVDASLGESATATATAEVLRSLEAAQIRDKNFDKAFETHVQRLSLQGALAVPASRPRRQRESSPSRPISVLEAVLAERSSEAPSSEIARIIRGLSADDARRSPVNASMLIARARLLFLAGAVSAHSVPDLPVSRDAAYLESQRFAQRALLLRPDSLDARRLVALNAVLLRPCDVASVSLLEATVRASPIPDIYGIQLLVNSLLMLGRAKEADPYLKQLEGRSGDEHFLRCFAQSVASSDPIPESTPSPPWTFWRHVANLFLLTNFDSGSDSDMKDDPEALEALSVCATQLFRGTSNEPAGRVDALVLLAFVEILRGDPSKALRHLKDANRKVEVEQQGEDVDGDPDRAKDRGLGICRAPIHLLWALAHDPKDVGLIFWQLELAKAECPALSWRELYECRQRVLTLHVEMNYRCAKEALGEPDIVASETDALSFARACLDNAWSVVGPDPGHPMHHAIAEIGDEVVRLERIQGVREDVSGLSKAQLAKAMDPEAKSLNEPKPKNKSKPKSKSGGRGGGRQRGGRKRKRGGRRGRRGR